MIEDLGTIEYIGLADDPDDQPEVDDDWPRMPTRSPRELSAYANELRKAQRDVAWMPWGIVESAVEVARGVDDPEELDRALDTLVATLKLLLGPSRLRTTPPRWSLKPNRTGRLVLRKYSGGRRSLEESPSSQGRLLAHRANEMMARGEVPTLLDAAVRLGMPKYDARRPDLDRKAEVTAQRRLSRYIQRFGKSEGQTE